MGTDIYLVWDGMTKKDKEKQFTGFDISTGNVGYLRASIGMVRENSLLHMVFGKEYWESDEPLRYKFTEKGLKELAVLGKLYLISVLENKPFEEKNSKDYSKIGESVALALAGKEMEVHMCGNLDFFWAVIWLSSLFQFYQLGLKKEKEGKNPKVYISW